MAAPARDRLARTLRGDAKTAFSNSARRQNRLSYVVQAFLKWRPAVQDSE